MFLAFYSVILPCSALLVAWALARGMILFSRASGIAAPLTPGAIALLITLGFLIVVSAPPALLTACSAILILGIYAARFPTSALAQQGLLLLAVIAAVLHWSFPPLFGLPPFAVMGIAALLWYGMTLSGTFLPNTPPAATLTLLPALLPLILAPVIWQAPGYFALDATVWLAACLGVWMAYPMFAASEPAGRASAFLLGGLLLLAALNGVWIAALISLLAWGATLAYAGARTPQTLTPSPV